MKWFKRKDLQSRTIRTTVTRGADAVIRPDLVRKAIEQVEAKRKKALDGEQ